MTDEEARREMASLCIRHDLHYTHNPGGVEFNGPNGFRCQVYGMDDVEDLTKLLAEIKKAAAS